MSKNAKITNCVIKGKLIEEKNYHKISYLYLWKIKKIKTRALI